MRLKGLMTERIFCFRYPYLHWNNQKDIYSMLFCIKLCHWSDLKAINIEMKSFQNPSSGLLKVGWGKVAKNNKHHFNLTTGTEVDSRWQMCPLSCTSVHGGCVSKSRLVIRESVLRWTERVFERIRNIMFRTALSQERLRWLRPVGLLVNCHH